MKIPKNYSNYLATFFVLQRMYLDIYCEFPIILVSCIYLYAISFVHVKKLSNDLAFC